MREDSCLLAWRIKHNWHEKFLCFTDGRALTLTVSLAVCLVHGAFAQYQFEPAGKKFCMEIYWWRMYVRSKNYKSRKMAQSGFHFLLQFYFTGKDIAFLCIAHKLCFCYFCSGVWTFRPQSHQKSTNVCHTPCTWDETCNFVSFKVT